MKGEFNVAFARDHFPSLKQKQVFCDNAGGSQVLGEVISSIQKYLTETNVQLGASYGISKQSASLFGKGYEAAAKYINASIDEIVLGGSTTQLFRNLSYALRFETGSEIVLSVLDHETNISPWIAMAERQGLVIKWWTGSNGPNNPRLDIQSLEPLLSKRTRFVACTHISNLLGTIHDIKAIAEKVHTIRGALFCVDGVAYAPHRQIDVRELGIDFYAFSWYKAYGPHMAMLFARLDVLERIQPLGHFFNPKATLANRLELAAANYELTQSIVSVIDYFGPEPNKAFQAIAEHEGKLQSILLGFLTSQEGVVLFGDPSPNPQVRVPTITFIVRGRESQSVVEEIEKISDFGCRSGHMYAKRLVSEVFGLGDRGVIRISLVHYNTVDEAKGLVDVLRKVLDQ